MTLTGARREHAGRHYAQTYRVRVPEQRLLRRSSEAFLFLVKEAGKGHEVIGKHGCADQHLKALTALGQTSLHAAAAKEHRDATFNACSETLSFLELRAFFERFAVNGPFSTPLRNVDQLYTLVWFAVLIAEKASIRTVPIGNKPESLLMTLKRRLDVDVIGGITLKYIVLGDQTSGTFSQKDLVAKFDWFLLIRLFQQTTRGWGCALYDLTTPYDLLN